MSDVPREDIHSNPENREPTRPDECAECRANGLCDVHRAEALAEQEPPSAYVLPQDCRNCGPLGRCDLHQAAKLRGGLRLTKVDADGQPTGESTFVPEAVVHVDLTPPGGDLLAEMTRDAEPYADRVDIFGPPRTATDAGIDACEIMRRVNGQPEYPSQAEVVETTRERLTGASLPAGGSWPRATRVPLMDTAAEFTSDRAVLSGEIGEAYRRQVADAFLAEARADESSLRAMGATGAPGEMIFEIDAEQPFLSGRYPRPRLRVLLRGVEHPVSVDAVLDRETSDRLAELTGIVGEALAECAKKISDAMARLDAAIDPKTGQDR